MQFLLTKLYNTRYFYITYAQDLTYLFNTCIKLRSDPSATYFIGSENLGEVYDGFKSGSPVQFDLADCKFTPDTVGIIRNAMANGIEFIDTQDPCRNEILMLNKKRLSLDVSKYPDLPDYDPDIKIIDYIKNLDANVTYRTPLNNLEIMLPLVYMTMVVRPEINICFTGSFDKDFFKFVGDRLTLSDINNYNEFYLATPEGTKVVKPVDGKVPTQRAGMVTLEEALSLGSLVPTVLGKEKLFKVECWHSIFKECLHRLDNYRNTRKKSLEDVLLT